MSSSKVGEPVRGADGLSDSYRHGRYCSRVAERLSPHRDCKDWDSLGLLRMFAEIPWTRHGVDMVLPGLGRLFEDERSPLPATLWTFLQCGGDIQETIQQLNIHRGTLYYRLGRAEEILDIHLGDGQARLNLHAGLLLPNLAGLVSLGNAS